MTTNRKRANRGAGFTLVEILVVIVIIGLLAGISSTVLISARNAARSSVVATQMSQLSMALDEYKNQFGEYPPDFTDPDAVMRHVKKRWPRYDVQTYAEFLEHVRCGCRLSSGSGDVPNAASLSNAQNLLNNLDGEHVWEIENPASALVFWLGGLPDVDGKPSGFYANPKAPLGVGLNGAGNIAPLANPLKARRETPFFDFELKNVAAFNAGTHAAASGPVYYAAEASELEDASVGAFVYAPAFQQGDLPIVYFRPSVASPYEAKSFWFADAAPGSGAAVSEAVAYARYSEQVGRALRHAWHEENRFQLIHPGFDGLFGPDATLPDDAGGGVRTNDVPTTAPKFCVWKEDEDNIVNFAASGTLISECEE